MSDEIEYDLPVRRIEGDTLEERMTANAYHNILPARYTKKDENGDSIEDQEEVFHRVAKNIALGDLPYLDTDITITPDHIKPDHPRRDELLAEVFDDGQEEKTLERKDAQYLSFDAIVDDLSADARAHLIQQKARFRFEMENLNFIPNTPTIINAGDELQQLSACFVDSPDDDISDIHLTGKEAAEIFQSGGGVGYSFSHLRPYGDAVGSTGGIASGPITFMRTFDQLCETIAQGGARRGAQMGVMKVTHPDVIFFIHSKNKDVSLAETLKLNDPDDYTHNSFGEAIEEARELIDDEGRVPKHLRNAAEGHLSNFNISVGVTEDFMDAVQNDGEHTFINPRTGEPHIATEETKEMYSWFGLGDEVEVGEPLSVPADELWTRMIEGAHENGEPGVIYLDRMNDMHSFDTDVHSDHEIHATNPCSEQPLEEYEACNLGHINLSTIVAEDAPDWREFRVSDWDSIGPDERAAEVRDYLDYAIDWDELNRRIERGTRFLENVVTMSNFPVDEIARQVKDDMRKIGLGIMGYHQMIIQMGVRYGSDAGNEIATQVMQHINHESKRVSHELAAGDGPAEGRGSFGEWDKSKYANPTEHREWFEQLVGQDPDEWEDGFPIRNHNTTTIAPTGTTSMLGDTTGGCEPIYQVAYYKNVTDDVQGDEMLVEFDDYFLEVCEEIGLDTDEIKQEARDQMANNEFDGIDSLSNVPDSLSELFVTTQDLTAKEHASVQCAFQKGVDSAISKTVNAPNDSTVEDAKEVYEYIYENGGKSTTYYRDGTRSKQVLTTRAENTDFAEDMTEEDLIEAFDEVADDKVELLERLSDEVDGVVVKNRQLRADGGEN